MGLDFERVKSGIDMREWVISDIGQPDTCNRDCNHHKSPFRSERAASCAVWWDHFKDFGAGGYGGDVFDWVRYRQGCTQSEAFRIVDNVLPYSPQLVAKPSAKVPRPPVKPIKFSVLEYHQRRYGEAKYYYETHRGIHPRVAELAKLGLTEYTEKYSTSDGETISFKSRRYVLPTFVGKKVANIQYRIDEGYLIDQFYEYEENHPDIAAQIREEVDAIYPGEIFDDAFSLRFQKYRYKEGSSTRFHNSRILYGVGDNGKFVRRRLPYCLVGEGLLDALGAESHKYPAVGVPNSLNRINVEEVFGDITNVPVIWIATDADGKGDEYAEYLISRLGSNRARRIIPPVHDLNATAVAGELDEWLQQYGIHPVDNLWW